MPDSGLIHDLENVAEHLSNLWPIYIAALAFFGAGKRLNKSVVHQISGVVDVKLAPIVAELTPNGGGSMKDAVARLEDGQVNLSNKLLDVKETLNEAAAITTANQGRLQAVTANLPAAYYEMDADGAMMVVNDSYLELYGITEQEALNSNAWRKFISDLDLEMIDVSGKQALVSQRDWYCTFDVCRDGVVIPVVARSKALFTNDVFTGYSGAMTFDHSLLPKKQ